MGVYSRKTRKSWKPCDKSPTEGISQRKGDSEHPKRTMKPALLHEDEYLQILWDERTRVISIDWKEATSKMSDEDFKTELTLFAKRVEDNRAPRILIDVSKFRHRPGEEVAKWRLENISTRYNAAGVQRFAFLFSKDTPAPSMASQSSEGEWFLTRSFNSREQAIAWLTASE
jgi:SpoIIAA-like